MRKIHPISLKLNFTPNTLGCNGVTLVRLPRALFDLAMKSKTTKEESTFEINSETYSSAIALQEVR